MRKRDIIIAIILVLAVGAYAAYSFTKKPQSKYTTVEVAKGDVVQIVSATGTVEASKKLNLRFANSGKIEAINVKVGDRVESNVVLAKLNTTQLESQLAKANASLNAAIANLNKILDGATPEDIKVSETAVENAEISLDNAKQNLIDTQMSVDEDIVKAEKSVNSAQVTLDNANLNLNNTIALNENNLNQDYEDAWDVINASLLTASNSLDTNETVLSDSDAQDTLSILDIQYLKNSSQSKLVAGNSYNSARNYVNSIKSNPSHKDIDNAIIIVKSALLDIRNTLGDTSDVLQATITSSKLTQAELDTLKSDIFTARSNISTAISNMTAAEQNISAQKVANQTNLDSAQSAVNSAQSALDLAKQSLAVAQVSAEMKVNAARNEIKSAEGVLKQARDQLMLKRAKPSDAEVSLYKARVQEARANVNLIQNQINDSILISPQKGIITEINGEVGETITSAENFVSMIAAENFEIKANISEVDIAKVKVGDGVEITFDAFGPDRKFEGKIVKIDPAETEISGVIYYKVTTAFVGNSEIIKPGMTANLDIMTARRDNVIAIPFQALKEKEGRKYVQVLENGKLRDVFVEIGLEGDINLEVLKGLREGQRVVTFIEE
jgi:HlyD family secretion protein